MASAQQRLVDPKCRSWRGSLSATPAGYQTLFIAGIGAARVRYGSSPRAFRDQGARLVGSMRFADRARRRLTSDGGVPFLPESVRRGRNPAGGSLPECPVPKVEGSLSASCACACPQSCLSVTNRIHPSPASDARTGPTLPTGRWHIAARFVRPIGMVGTATTPPRAARRQPGAVLPLGAPVAPVAPMCASAGRFWRVYLPTAGLVFIAGTLLAGSRASSALD